MRTEQVCDGWSVYWPGAGGSSLQGWYKSIEEAERTASKCQEFLDRGDKPPSLKETISA